MRGFAGALCVLVCSSSVAKPLTRGQKIAAAGIALVAAGYSTDAMIGMTDAALSGTCLGPCEGGPPPQDVTPLYGVIPLAGPWIQVGRHAGDFSGSSLLVYAVPGTVELVGLTLLLIGSNLRR